MKYLLMHVHDMCQSNLSTVFHRNFQFGEIIRYEAIATMLESVL